MTPDNLNDVMEFDHVIRVHEDGTVTDGVKNVWAPEVYSEDDGPPAMNGDWKLMNGYSGQDRYSGPIMHPSEFIGGQMARDILETPGLYVAIVVDTIDGEADGWAVAYRETEA